MNIQKFKLRDGRKLYMSSKSNRFWLNETPSQDIEPTYFSNTVNKLRLEITHLCNGKCRYCIVFGNEIDQIDSFDIRESWDWLLQQPWFGNIRKIFIIGGEPLIRFEDIAFLLENFKGEVRISTNATLITDDIAEKLAIHNALVYASLDGPDFSDNLMRVYKDGSYMYGDIIEGLSTLKQYGCKFGIFMVATKHNVHKAAEVIKEIDQRYSPVRIGYSLPHWTSDISEEITADEYCEALLSLYDIKDEIKAEVMQISWRLDPLSQGKVKKHSCALHTTQVTVLPDRSVVRCSKIDHDPEYSQIADEEFSKKNPLMMAENGEYKCNECIALASCGGGCPFDGLKRFQVFIDKRECIITPPVIERAVNQVIDGITSRPDLPDGLIEAEVIKEILHGIQ